MTTKAPWHKPLGYLAWLVAGLATLFVIAVIAGLITALASSASDSELAGLRIKTEHGVGIIELSGEIISAEKFNKRLKDLVEHKQIKAVVVRIESPGGSVGASEEIYRAIKEADLKKPVVCSLGNVAASGGLYAAMGCRKVVVNEGTITGSIGVIFMMPNVSSISERLGFSMNVVKSGRYKDSGSPFRKLDEEERGVIQALVDQTYEQFVRVIAQARKIPAPEVKTFADGRIILGEQSLKLGLADEIGGLSRAAKLALELSGDKAEPELVRPKKPSGIWSLMGEMEESAWWNALASWGEARLLFRAFL